MSLIAGRGCRWPPRRDSVSPCAPLSGGGRDTHDGHENSPILVFFSNLLLGCSRPGRNSFQVANPSTTYFQARGLVSAGTKESHRYTERTRRNP